MLSTLPTMMIMMIRNSETRTRNADNAKEEDDGDGVDDGLDAGTGREGEGLFYEESGETEYDGGHSLSSLFRSPPSPSLFALHLVQPGSIKRTCDAIHPRRPRDDLVLSECLLSCRAPGPRFRLPTQQQLVASLAVLRSFRTRRNRTTLIALLIRFAPPPSASPSPSPSLSVFFLRISGEG